MSQEQQDRVEQVQEENNESPASTSSSAETQEQAAEAAVPDASSKKRRSRKKEYRIVTEAEISPHPSFWPLALAIATVVMLLGAVTFQKILLLIGTVLVIGAVIGWVLERR